MKHALHRPSWMFLSALLLAALSTTVWIGCGDKQEPSIGSSVDQEEILLGKENPEIRAVMNVQDRHTVTLLSNPEVVGTATGLTEDGRPAILVFTKSDVTSGALAKRSTIPSSIEGVPVVVEVSGPIVAFDGGPNHQINRPRPIELGVSGGNANDIANGFCCSGTLGALVKNSAGTQFILSNSHVFAHDVAASAGDLDVAQIGDPINQRGLVDRGCVDSEADHVATLSSLSSLVPGSNADAAIAQVIAGQVRTDGSILDIGTISSQTAAAALRQRVKKSGRTSGLTKSRVSGLNATVTVGYDNECNGQSFTKLFTGQIIVRNGGFLVSGDSGSLMVQDVATNPKAVGLLYAGSNTIAVANPIGQVLTYLNTVGQGNGFSMVGN